MKTKLRIALDIVEIFGILFALFYVFHLESERSALRIELEATRKMVGRQGLEAYARLSKNNVYLEQRVAQLEGQVQECKGAGK